MTRTKAQRVLALFEGDVPNLPSPGSTVLFRWYNRVLRGRVLGVDRLRKLISIECPRDGFFQVSPGAIL